MAPESTQAGTLWGNNLRECSIVESNWFMLQKTLESARSASAPYQSTAVAGQCYIADAEIFGFWLYLPWRLDLLLKIAGKQIPELGVGFH